MVIAIVMWVRRQGNLAAPTCGALQERAEERINTAKPTILHQHYEPHHWHTQRSSELRKQEAVYEAYLDQAAYFRKFKWLWPEETAQLRRLVAVQMEAEKKHEQSKYFITSRSLSPTPPVRAFQTVILLSSFFRQENTLWATPVCTFREKDCQCTPYCPVCWTVKIRGAKKPSKLNCCWYTQCSCMKLNLRTIFTAKLGNRQVWSLLRVSRSITHLNCAMSKPYVNIYTTRAAKWTSA